MSQSGSNQTTGLTPRPATGASGQPEQRSNSSSAAVAVERFDQPTVITSRPPEPPASGSPAVAVEPTHLATGTRLDHFEIESFVGGGGMGTVYKANDTLLNRTVAIKVLSPEQAVDQETVQRFRNEAKSAARLDHDNIARVYYVGHDQGLHYIAFEFVDGVNIRQLVERNGPLGLADAISYALQVAAALEHASGRDVVHRDVKPSNVLIAAEGKVKLVDMGLARLHQVEHSGNDLTASGVTLGTFDYISPEQALDPRSADVRSDIYSLGCTLYFMVAARPPFPDGTVLQKLLKHKGDEPPEVRDLNPDVPEELARVLRKMLSKDPRRRQQTARELSNELAAIGERYGLNVFGGPRAVAPVASNPWIAAARRSIPIVVPACLLVVAVLVLEGSSPSAPDAAPWAIDRRPIAAATQRDSTQGIAAESPTSEATTIKEPGDESEATVKSATGRATPKEGGTGQPDERVGNESTQASSADAADGNVVGDTGPIANSSEAATEPEGDQATAALDQSASQAAIDAADADPVAANAGEQVAPATTGLAESGSNPMVRPEPLVVGDRETGPNRYRSLAAACAAAKSGDRIELAYDGRREERPIHLTNKRLTIAAADGFNPIVAFRPSPTETVSGPPWGFIAVAGERLTLEDLAIELELPRNLTQTRWSLFATQQAEFIRLERCSLSIENAAADGSAFYRDVAFFDVLAGPGSRPGMPEMMGDPLASRPVGVDLNDCVVRGEATFLRSAELQPVDLEWNNGLLATTGPLIAVVGRTAPSGDARVKADLRYLTAFTRDGLCVFRAAEGVPHQAGEITSLNCVFAVGDRQVPLIDQLAIGGPPSALPILSWKGDQNCFQGYETLWRISQPNATEDPKRLTAADMEKAGYERAARKNELTWRGLPPPSRPFHSYAVEDFLIDTRGPERISAGFDPVRLPRLPIESP